MIGLTFDTGALIALEQRRMRMRALAKIAGEAIATTPGATLVDAIVMASAASRGDAVYTSDVGDLERLRRRFPSVRILAA
ncbi:MAG: hypothetical protein J0L92_11990 [Deltaproteobacteria bacterium]|nr:hypothetical protein [Deltaproteobacteria bacterium]